MKPLTTLRLALVVASATMVFGMTDAASATVLCHSSTSCVEDWKVGAKLTFSLVKESTLSTTTTGGIPEDTCSGSSLTAEITNTGSASATVVAKGEASGLTWSGCTNTTKTLTGGELEIHNIAGTNNGTVTAKGFAITVLAAGLDCAYGAGAGIDLGIFKPGSEGKDGAFEINAVMLRNSEHSNVFCPETFRLKATYTQTGATALFVGGSSGTVICHNTTGTSCSEDWTVEHIASLSLVKNSAATLSTTGGVIEDECTGAGVVGKLTNTGGKGSPVLTVDNTNLTWSGCTKATKTLTGGELEIHNIAGTNNGTVTAKGFAITVLTGGLDCAYGAATGTDLGTFKSGVEGLDGVLEVNTIVKRNNEHSNVFCPETAKWVAKYTQTTETAAFIRAS